MTDFTSAPADAAALTDAGSAEFRIVVNGLEMGTQTWARIVAAIRGLYPTIALAGLSDAAAVQAVMKEVTTEWVATWEARQQPDPGVAAQQAMQQANAARAAAHDQAVSDLSADVQPTVTT